jgi:hypothetical protein
MPASVPDQIMVIVKDYNDRSIPICLKDLMELVDASGPTVHKHVNRLIEDRELEQVYVQTRHGTRQDLHVVDHTKDQKLDSISQMLGKLTYQVSRVADALEKQNGKQGSKGGRRHHDNQFRQTRL